jgi:hypothetical protein
VLFVFAVMLPICGEAKAERRIALVIGNSGYSSISPLRNPKNDADLMAATLTDMGFEVLVETDVDRRDMARLILDFGHDLALAGPGAVGLFYYAGHGVQANGTNYLMPLQARVDTEADLEIEAVDANWVLAQMDEASNGLNIVILDACRNNPYEGSFRSSDRGLARLDAPAGSLIAYSAAPGQTAVDGDGDNSPYTASLARAMREPGVELLQVFRRVRIDVEQATSGRQTPWEEQSLRADFFFVDAADDTAAHETTTAASSDTAPPSGSSSNSDIELAFWNSVKDSGNPAILRTYLNRYPNGVFADLAAVMLDVLEGDDIPGNAADAPADAATPGTGEPPPDPDLPRHIQTALDQVGCDPGPIDGVWGGRSQQALESFAEHANAVLPQPMISAATLGLIEQQDGRVCPLVCSVREEVRDGRCVTKTCADGEILDSSGTCVTQTASPPEDEPDDSQRTFNNPTVRGLPVDICVSPRSRCRGQAATRFCLRRGYARAVDFSREIYPETAHITGGTCRPEVLKVCGGYSMITCER